jgi:hypothetical protein
MERKSQAVWTVSKVSLTLVLVAACLPRSAQPPAYAALPTHASPAISAVVVGRRVVLVASQEHGSSGATVLVELFPPEARRRGPIRARPLAGGRPLDPKIAAAAGDLQVWPDMEDAGPGPVTVTWQVAPLAGAAIEVELGGVCVETDCEPMTIVVPLDYRP